MPERRLNIPAEAKMNLKYLKRTSNSYFDFITKLNILCLSEGTMEEGC